MSSTSIVSVNTLRMAIPIGVGIVSLAYLSAKLFGNRNVRIQYENEQAIPKVALRDGETTHDAEYYEDPQAFLLRCEKIYGPVFQVCINNQVLTAVSGSDLAREVHFNEALSFRDNVEDTTGYRAYIHSLVKSHVYVDTMIHFQLIKEGITTKLSKFTPSIVKNIGATLDEQIGLSKEGEPVFIASPVLVLQDALANAMTHIFMGTEMAMNTKVPAVFTHITHDFGVMLNQLVRARSITALLKTKVLYRYLNPIHKHRQVLVDAAKPILEQRRLQKKYAAEHGLEYENPHDLLQRMIDNKESYGFKDLEDICGHLILLVLSSMHTTLESALHMIYHLSIHPDVVGKIYDELQDLLDQQTKDREEQRQSYRCSQGAADFSFVGTDLDQANDREISDFVTKRAVHLDSFLREIFRYRTGNLASTHMARSDVMLSTGHIIRKGEKVSINCRSIHLNDNLQGDEANEFRPWRFVGKNSGATKATKEYLAFGLGRYTCPGRFLAIHDLKILCMIIVSKYSLITADDNTKVPGMLFLPIAYDKMPGLYFTSRKVSKEKITPAHTPSNMTREE
ncbi:hypothetical protein FBU30_009964 [Linnemannia zychae]|nr:hypothetical protein FBU30_009964 [Linnemannia zychae]